jgi:large subunit ribosomal protein L4
MSSKLQDNHLVVLDKFPLERIKTKDVAVVLKDLNLDSALIVTDRKDSNLECSSRNLPGVKVLRCEGLNVYDVLRYDTLVLLEASIQGIEGRLAT